MKVVFFDSDCALCDSIVQKLLQADKGALLKFSALNSQFAQSHGVSNRNSIAFLNEGKLSFGSDAVIEILATLEKNKLSWALKCLPLKVREGLYNQVAKHRYKWFGKAPSCLADSPELRERFL